MAEAIEDEEVGSGGRNEFRPYKHGDILAMVNGHGIRGCNGKIR
jgi:hypothetical protein